MSFKRADDEGLHIGTVTEIRCCHAMINKIILAIEEYDFG